MNSKKISLLFLTMCTILFTSCEKKEESKKEVEKEVLKQTLNVHTIKKQTYPIWIDFTGKTEAYEKVSIKSRVSGEIEEIYFKAGQEVKKGDLLFKIDDKSNQNILSQKKSSLAKNQASLNLAIANLKRYEPLVQKGLAPREKLDELKASVAQYRAVVKADKAAVNDATLSLDHTLIKATMNGKVGKAQFDVGNIISTSDILTIIVESKQLYVNFNPSSKDVFLLNQYKSEKFPKVKVLPESIENDDLSLEGRVDFIDSSADESTGTVLIRAVIDNNKGLLFPGSFVNIKLFVTDKIPVLAVHPNSLSQNQLGTYLYIVDENLKVKKRQVVVEFTNNDIAIIKDGLIDGDRVVIGSTNRLTDNLEVNPIEVENPVK